MFWNNFCFSIFKPQKRIFMKLLIKVLTLFTIMFSFSQCSSSKEASLQKQAPVNINKPYFQSWVAGVKGGGAGINVFIPVSDAKQELDSVYFRGEVSKLEVKPQNPNLYIGRFNSNKNRQKDIVMSSDPREEYGNQLPELKQNIPFQLKDNECVISYIENGVTKYFKIKNLTEKASIPFPSAKPKQ